MAYTVSYRVLDPRVGHPTHEINVDAEPEEIQSLIEKGFLVRKDWFSTATLTAMRAALDRIYESERDIPDERIDRYGGWRYFRHLMDKDPVFLDLLWFAPPRTIAQAVLGPQVRFDQVDAKYGLPDISSQYVPWHIHHRVVPDPIPPFFSYPHAIHCLLYLDDIGGSNGPLCVLPGSHRRPRDTYIQDQNRDIEGQVILSLDAGACVMLHANLWHRVLPSLPSTGYRRVVIFGYLPAWVTGTEKGGRQAGTSCYRAVEGNWRRCHSRPAGRVLLGLVPHTDFRPDDFDAINATYFSKLRTDGRPLVDPSGWTDTLSAATELLPEIPIGSAELGRYYLDEGRALGTMKEAIVQLIASWEARPLAENAVTLCHSISEGTLLILVVLRRRGIREILFETPGYAVTMNQSEYFGFRNVLIPTRGRDQFRAKMAQFVPAREPTAIWITQARMSIGSNQSPHDVRRILESLGAKDFLVVDDATEQMFPSVLREAEVGCHPRLIRIRGLTKGMGLNGLRLAFMLHDPSIRDDLESAQEVVGGSLDLFSLRAGMQLAFDVERFKTMLTAARRQTSGLRERAAKLAANSGVQLSQLVNGYMGSAWLSLTDAADYDNTRRRFLTFCRERRMPVILAASMRFAFDQTFEMGRAKVC